MDIFRAVVDSPCDALYFGGRNFNMRMIRRGFNFSDEELREAVAQARSRGKRSYVTVNNLVDGAELGELSDYLRLLEEIRPDALIVQDYAVLSLAADLGLSLDLHASVMMNVHNLPTVEALSRLGVSRVVLSRELSLLEVRALCSRTEVEVEYFTHGDMCVAHGAQCSYSSMLFGMSSNRGRCLKPCRWWFDVVLEGRRTGRTFPLAVRDLCLYPYLPELIDAGVTSFKLEGRMKEKEAVVALVEAYADALDRYIDDPVGFDRYVGYGELHAHRKRDLSSGYAFGKPGLSNLNSRWEGTGKFYSTGKMFSVPTPEPPLDLDHIELIRSLAAARPSASGGTPAAEGPGHPAPRLSVRVQTLPQAEAALRGGADRVYLAADVYLPDRAFRKPEILDLAQKKGRAELYLCLPRMMTERHFAEYSQALPPLSAALDGVLATNLGAIAAFSGLGLALAGDSCLNVCNPGAASLFRSKGGGTLAASVELSFSALADLCSGAGDIEVVGQGPLVAMYLDHDLYAHFSGPPRGNALEEDASVPPTGSGLYLENEAGRLPVRKDVHGRCHLLSSRELCLLPVLDSLRRIGVSWVRIEGQTYEADGLERLVRSYRSALEDPGRAASLYASLSGDTPGTGYFLGSLIFNN